MTDRSTQPMAVSHEDAAPVIHKTDERASRLRPRDAAVVAAAAAPAFQHWLAQTLPQHARDDVRSVVLAAVQDVQTFADDNGPCLSAATLQSRLQFRTMWHDAVLQYGAFQARGPRDNPAWSRFVRAPYWPWLANRRFRYRDRQADGGDVTRDPRFVRAQSEVWEAAHEAAVYAAAMLAGEPPPGGLGTRAQDPPALFDSLIRVYGRTHPHNVDNPASGQLQRISLDDLLACPDDDLGHLGTENAAYESALEWGVERRLHPALEAEGPDEFCSGGEAEFQALIRAFETIIDRLPPQQRRVLLATIKGQESRDVAAQLQRSVSTVDNTRRQGRAKVIRACVRQIGRDAFWRALPDRWKTRGMAEIIHKACGPTRSARGTTKKPRS